MLLLALLAAACGNPVRSAPNVATATVAIRTDLAAANASHGQQLFSDNHCVTCHGSQALGGVGPKLARTDLAFDAFLVKIRTALPPKPAFSAAELSDQDAMDIYGWLQTLSGQGEPVTAPPFVVVQVQPGQEELPATPILGMSLWTGFACDQCHGAFAQGSSDGPSLAGISYPYEMERAKMRQTADTIPQHDQSFMRDTVLKRLYQWLQEGADPGGGC
jgi:mono/diheme cytochrome c family protein